MIFTPMSNKIFVTEFKKGERILSGIIIPNDDRKASGIRPRWAKVYATGSEITSVTVGDWVLIDHGRWSRKLDITDENEEPLEVWVAEELSIMLVSKTEPNDEVIGS